MPQSVYPLLKQLASIMHTFNQLGIQHTSRLLNQLDQYGDLTDGQVSWMRLKAGAIITTALLSGVTGISTAFFPKGASNSNPILDPRLNANSAVNDKLQLISELLRNNSFTRNALKTAATYTDKLGSGIGILLDIPTTKIEAERTKLTQVHLQSALEGQNSAQKVIDMINQCANSIIEKKARGAA